MERDRLQSNLQRTAEECKRLVREGDEQVERITKESEIQARYLFPSSIRNACILLLYVCY